MIKNWSINWSTILQWTKFCCPCVCFGFSLCSTAIPRLSKLIPQPKSDLPSKFRLIILLIQVPTEYSTIWFYNLHLARLLPTPGRKGLFAKGNIFTFEPSVGTNYGDNSFYYRWTNINLGALSLLRIKYGDNITIKELMALKTISMNKQIEKQLSQLSPTATLGQIFNYTAENQFNSVELIFPCSYSLKRLTLNTSLNISIPMNVPLFLSNKTHVYFSGGISYSFDL